MMIGNNMQEDIVASRAVSMNTYLITDCLIDNGEKAETPNGSFKECIEFLKKQ
jgi:hypothetical protein